MRVVIFSSVPAFPATSGNRARICRLAEELVGSGFSVLFVYAPLRREDVDAEAHKRLFGKDGFLVLGAASKVTFRALLFRLSVRLRRGLSYVAASCWDRFAYLPVDHAFDPRWLVELRGLLSEADAVVSEYVFSSRVLEVAPSQALKIVDTHDVFANRHRRFMSAGRASGYWLTLSPEDEFGALGRADVILAIQSHEAEYFRAGLSRRQWPGKQVVEVGHMTRGEVVDGVPGLRSATFVASRSAANIQGLAWFIEAVVPKVLERIPDFRLNLVGSICEAVKDAGFLRKWGVVDSVERVYREAPLAINPVLVGTGLNIKLIDALALGIPVVSSMTGVRGVDPEFLGGVSVVQDSNPDEFANELCRLLLDDDLRNDLSARASADAMRWNSIQRERLMSVFKRKSMHAP